MGTDKAGGHRPVGDVEPINIPGRDFMLSCQGLVVKKSCSIVSLTGKYGAAGQTKFKLLVTGKLFALLN